MNQVENLKKLNNLSYFDKNTLSQIIELSENSLYANIKRWLNDGHLVQLKKGLYVTKEYLNSQRNKDIYFEFVANQLKVPSYLSLEYVLQKHSMLSEAIFAITSVTKKSKREYSNKLGKFIYRNIKAALFCGFDITDRDGFQIKVATKSKALFDYLYLKLYRVKLIDRKIIESFRLNFDEFSQKDLREFKKYCELTGISKFDELPKIIRELL